MSKPNVSYEIVERSDSWIRVKVELSHPFRGFTHQVLSLPLPEFAEDAAVRRRVCDKLKMETGLLVYEPGELQEIKPAEPVATPKPPADPEPKKKRKGGR